MDVVVVCMSCWSWFGFGSGSKMKWMTVSIGLIHPFPSFSLCWCSASSWDNHHHEEAGLSFHQYHNMQNIWHNRTLFGAVVMLSLVGSLSGPACSMAYGGSKNGLLQCMDGTNLSVLVQITALLFVAP